jgi:hypothetical protein
MTLVETGKTSYTIVVENKASEVDLTAAKELKSYLDAVTNAKFPIESISKVSGPKIYVGLSKKVRELTPDVRWNDLKNDGIVIKTIGDDLILAGGGVRGTLYAVYTFLEDYIGVRWWTSTEEFVPKKSTLTLGTLNVIYCPKFFFREVYAGFCGDNGRIFQARLKLNGHYSGIPSAYGGYQVIHDGLFDDYLPPKDYFAKHPDWYSLVKGKRVAAGAHQLCLTNQEMQKEMIGVVLKQIRENSYIKIWDISPNDCNGACECEKCKALCKSEGSESGPLIYFINSIAKEVAKEFPDVWINTLAYRYTRKPPLHVKPAPNVIIQLCSIECLVDRPLADPVNAPFQNDMTGWSRIAPQLFVWDYVTNFSNYVSPQPNLYNFESNIRFFAENHVVGVFEQGNAVSPVGDFDELRAWVLAHLLWNPSLSEKDLIKEFLDGYYGPAAPYISSYLQLVQDSARRKQVHVDCYNIDYGFMGLSEMNQATRLLDAAEKAAANDNTILTRIHRDRLSFDFLWLLRYCWLKQRAEIMHAPFLGPKDPMIAYEKFFQTIQHLKAAFTEGGVRENPYREAYLKCQLVSRPAASLPSECQDKKWLDFQDSMFQTIMTTEVNIVDDPLASDGKALAIPGHIVDWVIRLPLSDAALIYSEPVHCYISVRVDARGTQGKAYSVGMYNPGTLEYVTQKDISLTDIADGKYHTCDLGVQTLKPGMILWIVGPGKESSVKDVMVDRFFVIKEKESD